MSDLIDDAQQLQAEHLVLSLAAARAPIPAGQPGECDNCGDEFTRLVGGLCGFCRDGRRPLLATTARPAVPPVTPITSEEEEPMAQYRDGKYVAVPCEKRVLKIIEGRAFAGDVSLGVAALQLIELGIDPAVPTADPVVEVAIPDGPITVVSLSTVPAEWLTDEIARRLAAAADPALVDAATARAVASEGQLATLREQLLGLIGES